MRAFIVTYPVDAGGEEQTMTRTEIEEWIAEIRRLASDSERAHGSEDELRDRFIRSVADGTCGDPAGLAALVLTTGDIEFSRWCA